jgi:hypothetical protein
MRKLTLLLVALSLALSPASFAEDKKKQAGSVRVYRFDNLDIEGRLKTPHLMYFLKRIKNKFRSFRLPRQNFKQKVIDSKNADFLK